MTLVVNGQHPNAALVHLQPVIDLLQHVGHFTGSKGAISMAGKIAPQAVGSLV